MASTLSTEVRGLLDQVTDAGMPTAAVLRAHFEARGLTVKAAGPNLFPRSASRRGCGWFS